MAMVLMVKQVRMVPVRPTEVFLLRIRVKMVKTAVVAVTAAMEVKADMLLRFMPTHT